MRLQRRTIGKVMIAIGVVGVLAGIGAVIVGETLVHQVETSVDDSLVVTTKGLAAVNDSIAATGTIVQTIREGVANVGTTLASVRQAIDNSSTAISDTGQFLGGSLPDSIAAVSNVLPTIKSVAHTIDTTLRTLSKAPFGPNYKPSKPFDQTIGDLSTALDPLPAQLRSLAKDFTGLSSSTSAISTNLATLSDDITRLQTQLNSVSTLVGRYSATAVEATAIAASSRKDLHDSARSTRWLLIALGLVFIAGQLVPIWLGTVLLSDESTYSVIAGRHLPDPPPPMRSPDPGDRMG